MFRSHGGFLVVGVGELYSIREVSITHSASVVLVARKSTRRNLVARGAQRRGQPRRVNAVETRRSRGGLSGLDGLRVARGLSVPSGLSDLSVLGGLCVLSGLRVSRGLRVPSVLSGPVLRVLSVLGGLRGVLSIPSSLSVLDGLSGSLRGLSVLDGLSIHSGLGVCGSLSDLSVSNGGRCVLRGLSSGSVSRHRLILICRF